ncbi:MAG: phage N-6-adenine-methyltransferase [Colwellia sp.]|nr:phage N-6-adenine-methyltransferase [Colwellia sp.]
MFSSKEEKWQTPQSLFDKLNEEFNFTLDPCCQHDSAKCEKYYTPVEDGLSQSWESETVFVNPPYGRELRKWVEKCYNEGQQENTKVVMLIPSRTDTTYFHDFIYHKSEIRFIRGRIKFINPTTKLEGNSAPFGSMVVVFK